MSSLAAHPPSIMEDQRVVLPHVSWETYERLLADDVERQSPRMTFSRGLLELVTPSMPHDEDAATMTRIVDIVAAILGIPIRSVGSTTFRRRDLERGFEPDASFYIQCEERIRGQREVDLTVDPAPDLILEMELTHSAIDKLGLFASMEIPEVWRCDGIQVCILVLDGDRYREASTSLALPVLTDQVLTRFLNESRTLLSPDWFRSVSEWASSQR